MKSKMIRLQHNAIYLTPQPRIVIFEGVHEFIHRTVQGGSMEERDIPPTKEERTLRGKSRFFDILFRWPLLPEKKLEMVRRFEERRELAIRLGFSDV